MNKKQREERKQKKREAVAKSRVAHRREKLREAKKTVNDTAKLEKHFRVKQAPIRKLSEVEKVAAGLVYAEPAMSEQTKVDDPRKVEYIKRRLEHNMKILEALEEEMKKEEEVKKAMKESMEAKGAFTLRDKLDLAGSTAEEFAGVKDWSNLSASEDVAALPEGFSLDGVEAFMSPNMPENQLNTDQ